MRETMKLGDTVVFYKVPHEFEFTTSTGYDTFRKYAGIKGLPLLAIVYYVKDAEVDILLDPQKMKGMITLGIDPSYKNTPYLDLISL